jgi:hypothetical protein
LGAALLALALNVPMNGRCGAAAAPADDIRDIRVPAAAANGWIWTALGAGGVGLALAAWSVVRAVRRRHVPLAPQDCELALQRLADMQAIMAPATAREFCRGVSDAVRVYIERRFDVRAANRTTEEFLRGLREPADASLVRHRSLLVELLQQCDLAKFAGVPLTRQNLESLHRSAVEFVRNSR